MRELSEIGRRHNTLPRSLRDSSLVSLGLPIGLLAGVLAATGFYDLYSSFMTYDDEGVLLLFARLLQSGYIPYRELAWLYGPVHVAQVQLVHGVLDIPLTHTAVRGLTLLTWLLIALLSGVLVRQLTGALLWAVAASVLSFLYVGSIVNEPGHPQGWITILALLALILSRTGTQRSKSWPWILAGCIVAAVVHTKVNAGFFVLAAFFIVLVAPLTHGVKVFRYCLVLGSFVTPFVLMSRHLTDLNCLLFASISGISCAAMAFIVIRQPPRETGAADRLARFVVGGLAVSMLLILYLFLLGTSPLDFITSLVSYASAQTSFYNFFSEYSLLQIFLALVSLLCLAWLSAGHWTARKATSFATARYAVFLAGLLFVVFDNPARAHWMMAWLGPWSWVVVFRADSQEMDLQRALLATVAVWSPMLAYPIPGTQLYLGSLPILLITVVCASDCLDSGPEVLKQPGSVLQNSARGLYLAVVLIALGIQLNHVYARYNGYSALKLPGAEMLRLKPQLARQYQGLAAEIQSSDTLITTNRFNSMYFWTKAHFPGLSAWSHFGLAYMPKEQQYELGEVLRTANNPVLLVPGQRGRKNKGLPNLSGLPEWVSREYQADGGNARYVIMRRKSQ